MNADAVLYRYAVVETWGDVPKQVVDMVGDDDAVLLYNHYRGDESQQALFNFTKGREVGGWVMEYRGEHPPSADGDAS